MMLPALIAHLPADRERLGLREVQMAGRLGLTLREYRALEAGELQLDYALYLRIVDVCGWPR
jgi:Helix-turn-helix domain